jgi:hypothetical protein
VWFAGRGDAVAVGVGDGLGTVAASGLGEDPVDVGLDCGFADVSAGGDLGVGQALGGQREDFAFAGAEAVREQPAGGAIARRRTERIAVIGV